MDRFWSALPTEKSHELGAAHAGQAPSDSPGVGSDDIHGTAGAERTDDLRDTHREE
jgi:hypothetical protein